MRYDKDRNWVRSVLKTSDIMNTLNGGMSQPETNIVRNTDHYLITLKVPGVNLDNVKVEIVDKHVIFHHIIDFNDLDDSSLNIPHVLATYPLTADVDYNNISATREDKALIVKLPFNELSNGYHREVNVLK